MISSLNTSQSTVMHLSIQKLQLQMSPTFHINLQLSVLQSAPISKQQLYYVFCILHLSQNNSCISESQVPLNIVVRERPYYLENLGISITEFSSWVKIWCLHVKHKKHWWECTKNRKASRNLDQRHSVEKVPQILLCRISFCLDA